MVRLPSLIAPILPGKATAHNPLVYINYVIFLNKCQESNMHKIRKHGIIIRNFSIKGDPHMVKHVILWTLKDTLSAEEKLAVKAGIREGLEGLAGRIPGLVEIKVQTEGLPSSNADLMLDSTFESEEALKGYSVHPEHVAVANTKVRPYTATRTCLDYTV
jgi:hypothetical protein